MRRRDCETPSHWIHPASQRAAKSNNDSDLTSHSYSIASRLITAGSLCASVNVSVCVSALRRECTLDTFVSASEDCFSVPGVCASHNFAIQSYCQKKRKRANPSYGIDVKQAMVDPYGTKATSFDSLSITPLLTHSPLQLQSTGWTNLADVKVI